MFSGRSCCGAQVWNRLEFLNNFLPFLSLCFVGKALKTCTTSRPWRWRWTSRRRALLPRIAGDGRISVWWSRAAGRRPTLRNKDWRRSSAPPGERGSARPTTPPALQKRVRSQRTGVKWPFIYHSARLSSFPPPSRRLSFTSVSLFLPQALIEDSISDSSLKSKYSCSTSFFLSLFNCRLLHFLPSHTHKDTCRHCNSAFLAWSFSTKSVKGT